MSWFAIYCFFHFISIIFQGYSASKPSLSWFCFGVSRASLASLSLAVSVVFLAGRQGWQQWLFITYIQWFGLPRNGEASGASRNSPWRTSNFPLWNLYSWDITDMNSVLRYVSMIHCKVQCLDSANLSQLLRSTSARSPSSASVVLHFLILVLFQLSLRCLEDDYLIKQICERPR